MAKEEDRNAVMWWARRIITGLLVLTILCIAVSYALLPWLNVWTLHMEGRAMLAKSEYSKKVLVQDAMARQESAEFLAKAEITRAEGVAKANKIIGESLNNNEAYLHYLWIHNLEEGNHDVIYVPTEAGLPIFEAGGRFHKTPRNRPALGEPGHPEHPEVKADED